MLAGITPILLDHHAWLCDVADPSQTARIDSQAGYLSLLALSKL
jgi:hypothetical protein